MKDRMNSNVIYNMRNQALSKAVIAITAVVVVIAGGMYFFSKTRDMGPGSWKTYTNKTYGVSFDYPDSYELTETSKGKEGGDPGIVVTLTDKSFITPINGEGGTAITVEMYDGSTTTNGSTGDKAKNWILTSTSSNFQLSKQTEPGETRLGDKVAWIYTWNGLYEGTSVVTEHDGNIISFSVTYDGDSDMQKREDFTKLMTSVRFDSSTSTKALEEQ